MEQNMTAAMPEMGGSKQQGNGLKIATAIASVIAVCGIGFGVYGMVQSSQKDNQISDLKVQIKNEDGSVTTIETPKIETTTENGGTTVTITDSTVGAENTEDYIYVGEWGIKIKKPENLENITYGFVRWDKGDYAGSSLCVAGSTTGHGDAFPSFLSEYNYYDSAHVCVSINTKSLDDGPWWATTPEGEYYIQGPQAMVGNEADGDWELESVKVIKEMLSTENMSAI